MMEGSESFTDTVLSWSLEDICNENLYKHQVEKIPESVQQFGACSYPLLDETRAQLQSSMESMHRAPFCQVNAIQESKHYEGETKLYDIEIDGWRNSDSGKELHKPIQGDVFVLADAKLETISDLRKLGKWWSLVIVTEVSTDKKEDDRTFLSLKVRAPKEFEVNNGNGTSLFLVFLANITPNLRIWNAMHMCISSRWKVLFGDNFMKSFKKLKSFQKKMSVLNLLLKLSSGWRPKKRNVDTICKISSMTLKQFKVDDLYIVLTIDIEKDLKYMQVLRMWDLLPGLLDIQKLADRLDCIFSRYTNLFVNLCREKCLEGHLEVPASWPLSLDVVRYKDLSSTKSMSNSVGDSSVNGSCVENSKVNESLLLMKFYSLSSGVVNFLLSDREDSKVDLPFEVTDQEREAVLYDRSTFILGRSGTGKTTVLTTKLYQKEQQHLMVDEGFYDVESNAVGHAGLHNKAVQSSSSALNKGMVLHQLFVTVSPKLCFAVKQHFLRLKSFASGRSSLVDMDDFDDEEAQFRGIPDSFCDIPPKFYPLFVTFHKFLMMLDGSLSNSYFERFPDIAKLPQDRQRISRANVLQTFLTTKEVTYARFSSSYWPHFDVQLTKKLDASRVFTEIISHIKGGLRALEAGDGKLSQLDYVQMSEGRASSLSQQKREIIYDIFQVYEKMKMRNGEFDIADFVNDIHHRLKCEKYKGDEIDFVYIDEVQDLAMSQIALFKHICSNVEEGFVFSGDTAQTIARGIDFRFQDIRHLFYKKFVLESRKKKHDNRKEKGQISNIFQLTQNFRSHDGILKLLQSIVELIYHFFPLCIDVLEPETSMIYGEAPILLYSGNDEKLFKKILGSSGIIAGNMGGFGADQVILVRDDCSREEISNSIGKQALVLTIVECKGLEFEDVLLYKFFGSSPLKNQWRVLYEFMQEQNLLDSTLPERFPSFDDAKHSMLCSELKQLYVAVSRTRQRLWIYENVEELSNPIFDYWKRQHLVQLRELDDSLAQIMQVASTSGDWRSRGIKLYHEHNYKMARMCFHKAGDTFWERRSEAAELKVKADHMRTSSHGEANALLRKAASIFEAIGLFVPSARCFYDLGEYERAGTIYLYKCGELELENAGECFYLAENYVLAADVYARGNFFFLSISSCLRGNIFHRGLEYIKYWRQHARDEYDLARQADETHEMELEFLEHCAFHYYEGKDDRSRMKVLRDGMLSTRKFLNAQISSRTSKYLWEEKLPGDLKRPSNKKYEKQVSIDSLVYFWNSWKDTVVHLFEYLGSIDVNDYISHGDFFLNYLGVWRHFHDGLNPLYLSLIYDIDWVRSIDKRSFPRNEESIPIDVHRLVLDAQSYWSSEMLSLGIKVLEKLEVLYNFAINNSDSVFCQSRSLILIYEVAKYLLESKFLKMTHYHAETLHRFVTLSTENFVSYIFPLDWMRSSREDMISLRQIDSCKCLLNQVIVEYISSTNRLSSGQMGCIAMIILGSGKLDNELYEKLIKNLDCNSPWKKFIEDLCDSIQSELPEGYNSERPKNATVLEYSVAPERGPLLGNISHQEPREVSLLWKFHGALFKTYSQNWSLHCYNITPDCFLYLVDCLLIRICCFQGYAITTRSCFIERLIYKEEHNQVIVDDVRISFECILQFLTDVVREFLFNKTDMIKWIKKCTNNSWKVYYSLLMQRLVFVLCLLYLNFGMGFDILLDLLRRKYITDQLPKEFCYVLRGIASLRDSVSRHVDVLARAFKKSGNPLVVASFGIDCSRFFCSDAIIINMKANICMAEIVRSLFPKHSMIRSSQGQTYTTENLRHWNRNNFPVDFDPLWEIFKGFKPAKERDQCNIFSDASKIKLDVEKIIRLLAAAWSGLDDKEERKLSREVLSMLDELVQLYAALDGSEREVGNNMATVAELSRRMQWRSQRFFWPEKIQPIFTELYMEHNNKLARKAHKAVAKSGHGNEAGNGDRL
ncbi:putative uvrD-like Helicase, ATP-binding domain, P-loop containing nucleoside triphosphate hydrolase [Rosa chinensis]|uniref:Putative uvrD-like Helicase, ATP-binding domain, P-loop containing nucleoside triphosphate hydrolase n=1 Tax=Rosa chinensis TaxID=74649 RepID=A0A2P6R4I4_ROSCH|nr:putative uvrD-like Helicase, ATP-binding domain, P-loop containing nucleoside triphosphate hydrolase [Rosa chinensis]